MLELKLEDGTIIKGTSQQIIKYCQDQINDISPLRILFSYVGNYELMRDGTKKEYLDTANQTLCFLLDKEYEKIIALESIPGCPELSYRYAMVMGDNDLYFIFNHLNNEITMEDIKENNLIEFIEDCASELDVYTYTVEYKPAMSCAE